MRNQNEIATLYYREDRIADYDINGNLLSSYTHGPGIDEPITMTTNNPEEACRCEI